MAGRIAVVILLLLTLVAGVGLYYTQIYAFYDEVETPVVRLTPFDGRPEAILASDLEAIDSDSSPIRYRACFQTTMSLALLSETYEPYEDAVPLNAPGWFSCFDADAIGAALEDGTALAFLGERDVHYGIDRIVAITETGQGFSWHQINPCGEVVFDGQPVPDGCPPPPERN